MPDIQVRGVHTRPKIKDWRRLQADGYYLSVDKADTANRNKDLRQLYIPELANAVEDELKYLTVFENFNKRINDTEQNITDLQNQVAALEARVFDLEQVQQILVDGIYAIGDITQGTNWSPGVTSPTNAARLPIDDVQVISNVNFISGFGFQAPFSADYRIDLILDLSMSGAQNNRNWTVAVFDNGVQLGNGFSFNTKDVEDLNLSAIIGGHFDKDDEVDVRLWSTNSASSLTVANYTYSFQWLGLDDPLASIVP